MKSVAVIVLIYQGREDEMFIGRGKRKVTIHAFQVYGNSEELPFKTCFFIALSMR